MQRRKTKRTKSPKAVLARKKTLKRVKPNSRARLAARYREIQWLRDLVAYLEQATRREDDNR